MFRFVLSSFGGGDPASASQTKMDDTADSSEVVALGETEAVFEQLICTIRGALRNCAGTLVSWRDVMEEDGTLLHGLVNSKRGLSIDADFDKDLSILELTITTPSIPGPCEGSSELSFNKDFRESTSKWKDVLLDPYLATTLADLLLPANGNTPIATVTELKPDYLLRAKRQGTMTSGLRLEVSLYPDPFSRLFSGPKFEGMEVKVRDLQYLSTQQGAAGTADRSCIDQLSYEADLDDSALPAQIVLDFSKHDIDSYVHQTSNTTVPWTVPASLVDGLLRAADRARSQLKKSPTHRVSVLFDGSEMEI